MGRRSYLSDVTDKEWALVTPYLTLMREDAPQRKYPLREMSNPLHYGVHGGSGRRRQCAGRGWSWWW
jgi:transposase